MSVKDIEVYNPHNPHHYVVLTKPKRVFCLESESKEDIFSLFEKKGMIIEKIYQGNDWWKDIPLQTYFDSLKRGF